MNLNNIEYPDWMDKKCIPLCDALNSIQGFETSTCTSGFETIKSFNVWFWVENRYLSNLSIIARILDRNYGGFLSKNKAGCLFPQWICTIDNIDTPRKDSLFFWLNSGDLFGEEACDQADRLAENIYYHLDHENYKKLFNVDSPSYTESIRRIILKENRDIKINKINS